MIQQNDPGLRDFLGQPTECRLMLPHFAGTATLAEDNTPSGALVYPGFTFAERDSRAAFHVQSLIRPVIEPEKIIIESAVAGYPVPEMAFLFGSRSNLVTQEFLKKSAQGLVEFEFGPVWKIRCSGSEFSMPDPSKLVDSVQYQNTTDYAVVSRIRDGQQHLVFVIAGLGGRATEGAASFFVKNWRTLATEFGQDDFAAVLQFAAPFDVSRCGVVSKARRSMTQFRYA